MASCPGDECASRAPPNLIWLGNAAVGAPRCSIGSVQSRIQRCLLQPRRTGSNSLVPFGGIGVADDCHDLFLSGLLGPRLSRPRWRCKDRRRSTPHLTRPQRSGGRAQAAILPRDAKAGCAPPAENSRGRPLRDGDRDERRPAVTPDPSRSAWVRPSVRREGTWIMRRRRHYPQKTGIPRHQHRSPATSMLATASTPLPAPRPPRLDDGAQVEAD